MDIGALEAELAVALSRVAPARQWHVPWRRVYDLDEMNEYMRLAEMDPRHKDLPVLRFPICLPVA